MTNRATLEVIGNIKKYQEEISKIPGATDREAFKAAVAMQRRMEEAAKKSRTAWDRIAEVTAGVTLGNLASKGFDIVTTAMRSAIETTADMVKGTLEAQMAIEDMAADSGFAVETIQALGEAAIASGEDIKRFTPSLNGFAKRMQDAANGGGEAAVAFKALGVEVKGGDGALRSMDAVLADTVKALQDVPPGAARSAAAVRIFGEQAGAMFRILNGKGLAEYTRILADAGVDTAKLSANTRDWRYATDEARSAIALAGKVVAVALGEEAAGGARIFTGSIIGAATAVEVLVERVKDIASPETVTALTDFATLLLDPLRFVLNMGARGAITSMAGVESQGLPGLVDDISQRTEERLDALRQLLASGTQDLDIATGELDRAMSKKIDPWDKISTKLDLSDLEAAGKTLDDLQGSLFAPQPTDAFDAVMSKWDGIEAKILDAGSTLEEYDRTDALLRQAQVKRLEELDALLGRTGDTVQSQASQTAKGLEEINSAMARSSLAAYRMVERGVFDMAKSVVATQEKSARRQHRIMKALAISEIAINTARASMQAFATASNYIEGIVSAALITATGVAQAALVGKEVLSYHGGGSPMGGGVRDVPTGRRQIMPDEHPAILRDGETVVDAPRSRRAGGAAGVRAALDGGGGGSTNLFQLVLDGEVLDAISARVVARLGGMLGTPRSIAPAGATS